VSTEKDLQVGENCVISQNVTFGTQVHIGHNCIIENEVVIGDNVYIDNNCIIRKGVTLESNSTVGSNCILGEYLSDFFVNHQCEIHPLHIGENAIIRSGSIIYGDTKIGKNFQSGHRITVREKASIGDFVSIGTLCDIQGNCTIGNYVRLHSNVHIGQLSQIDACVWIFPYVVLTNDPTPPSEHFIGVHVYPYAIIATAAIVMPGVQIESDSLIGAAAVVTKNVDQFAVVVGNPAKKVSDIRSIKNKITGQPAYPWRDHFDRAMPWEGSKFEEWYAALDVSQKDAFGFERK
jgi:acetyltransferase-like isoleucine patch superfamily enzyme